MERRLIRIAGVQAAETAAILSNRLTGLGLSNTVRGVEITLDAPGEPPLEFTLLPQDPPAFAAEKILDELDAEGIVQVAPDTPSQEEDAEIQDRLRRLGYIE